MSAFPECSPRCAPVSLERLSSHPPRHLANSNALVTEILIMKNHVHQGFMHADALLVFNEAKIAKAIHEEADSGPRCADHFCEGLLRNLGNQCFWIALLADFGHDPDHLFSCDFESGTGGDGSSGGQTQPKRRCDCFFSHEGVRS